MTACTAIGGIGCDSEKLSLSDLMGGAAIEAVRQSRFVELATSAIETAAARPRFDEQLSTSRMALTDHNAGQVGSEKLEFVSSVQRPGAAHRGEAPEQSSMDQIEARVTSMYADLTNYQVAWKIAQRIQQDISQLMKGS
jgi:hypothetical protein